LHIEQQKIPANFNVYVACSCSPFAISSPISAAKTHVWGFRPKKRGETQKKREESRGKLTDELKQKNVYLVNTWIRVLCPTKEIRPSHKRRCSLL
jgi:hypothetical protein